MPIANKLSGFVKFTTLNLTTDSPSTPEESGEKGEQITGKLKEENERGGAAKKYFRKRRGGYGKGEDQGLLNQTTAHSTHRQDRTENSSEAMHVPGSRKSQPFRVISRHHHQDMCRQGEGTDE